MHLNGMRATKLCHCSMDALYHRRWHGNFIWGGDPGLRARKGKIWSRSSYHRSTICMAQPRKQAPDKTVKIFCSGCKQFLYKYKKGGKGGLQKCFLERITEDETGGKLECPKCGVQFARSAMIRGRPANKIIGSKVFFQK